MARPPARAVFFLGRRRARASSHIRKGDSLAALTSGYHAAFLVGALFAAAAAAIGAALLRSGAPTAAHEGDGATGVPATAQVR